MQHLPSYNQLKNSLPLSPSQNEFIKESRQIIGDIINGRDERLLLIVGPCSIHDKGSARDFAARLKQLSMDVASHFYLVMRVFCEKPRTSSGWKGFLYDPYLNNSHALLTGLEWTRALLLDIITLKLPIAVEFLDPLAAPYYADLVSWGSIGARTSSSQIHRQLASGLAMPIGFKNSVAGDISDAIYGVSSARLPHSHIGMSDDGRLISVATKGNHDTHVVLRGGKDGPNFDKYSIANTIQQLKQLQLPARICVDCAHHNSDKQYRRQIEVFKAVLEQVIDGNECICGLMLESHIHAGNQPFTPGNANLKYGVSLTDACLDWEITAELIQWGAERLQQQHVIKESREIDCIYT